MSVNKIKLPDNTTQDIHDIRIPGVDSTVTANSDNVVTSGAVATAIDAKQDTLVSGTNIKTINSTTLLGSGNFKLIPYDDVLMPVNPFGGKKLYINSIDDAFYAANRKYWVKVTTHLKEISGVTYPYINPNKTIQDDDYWVDSPIVTSYQNIEYLFNGNYDNYLSCPPNHYMKVHIQFAPFTDDWSPSTTTSSLSGYPYGVNYLSYYYTGVPSIASQMRIYNKYVSHTVGWHLYTASTYIGSYSNQSLIEKIDDTSDYTRTCIEFIIFGRDEGSQNVQLTQIDYKLDRPNLASSGSTVTKFGDQNLYYDFNWYKHNTDSDNEKVVSIKVNSGEIEATKFKKTGGTSSQFLKADGSVDSNTYLTSASITGKADKVSGATSGNLAGLDSNGNLTDSGKSPSDFELVANKVTSISSSSTDTQYPSAKCVYDELVEKADSMESITHSDLKTLRTQGKLQPGKQYRITDYNCVTYQADTTSAGHAFDIIVTADSETKLNENARAIQHSGDTYFADNDLSAWQLKYSLDNDEKYRWCVDRDSITANNTVFYRYSDGDATGATYPICWRSDSGAVIYTSTDTPAVNDSAWLMSSGMVSYTITAVHQKDINSGKGVIYWMKDEFGNECPYDFKNILYVGVITQGSSSLDAYTFYNDIIGTITDASILGYANNNIIKPYISGKSYILNKNILQAFTYNASYNNYFGLNCHNNIISSNSSNIFLNEGCVSNTISNCYNVELGCACTNNTFSYSHDIKMGSSCANNAFGAGGVGNASYYIVLGDACDNNSFGQNAYITLGSDCSSVNLSSAAMSNRISIGNGSASITFTGVMSGDITIGNGCSSISFSQSCTDIKIGDGCTNINLGREVTGTSIGEHCSNITIGREGYGITIGNYCNYIKFGDSSNVKDYYKNITVESGNGYIYLYCSETTASNSSYQNVTIASGVNNTTTWKTITDSNVGQTFKTTYQPANSQVISV